MGPVRVRVITLRYSEGVQGFPEEALRQATAGHEVLEVREHSFVYGNVPQQHLARQREQQLGLPPREHNARSSVARWGRVGGLASPLLGTS
jgi:hypothetical protein